MPRDVYVASVGLTKVDLTGKIFSSIFDLFAQAYQSALEHSDIRSFDAVQIGIMDSEEFENRANIAAKVVDRIGLTGVPAVRTETASSTGAAAFHEACYKIASGEFENVLVIAGERMKMVTTEVATAIMSKTVDPVERRFGFTMPGLIALVTQAWVQEQTLDNEQVRALLARLMHRAHALGSQNPLAAFYEKPEPIAAYYDETRNLPVASPLMRKDCSPICDGAAAVVLTAKPQGVRVAGLGSATETSSILDRSRLSGLDATTHAAQVAYWRAGIAQPRQLEKLVVEVHDAFNSLLPIGLADLGLLDADEVIPALIGELDGPAPDPYEHPVTGPGGSLPTNLSGGLKARGHPVGGTGLFQIAENHLQLTGGFPNAKAQVRGAEIALCHSIGGPGNNVYVTLLERSDSKRTRDEVTRPMTRFAGMGPRAQAEPAPLRQGAPALVEAATTIHVTAPGVDMPVHVALLSLGNQRVFARMDRRLEAGEGAEQVLAGQKVRLLVKDDGDHYFQIPKPRGIPRLEIGQILERIRRRVRS
jgi:acetyl-CoA acetyltransferase